MDQPKSHRKNLHMNKQSEQPDKSDFQKAAEWFFSLSHEEATAICKEVNPNTPYSMSDKRLVPMWKKYCLKIVECRGH